MKVIGLTGGIGCGKTLVSNLLNEHYSCCLCIADEIGRQYMEKGKEGYQKIRMALGNKILDQNGEIDRNKLSDMAFHNPEILQILNGIIHPLVRREVEKRMKEKEKEDIFFVIESAILLEAGYESLCDEIWYVWAPEEIRRERLKKNRGYSDEKIDGIIRRQMKESELKKRCDRILDNSQDKKRVLEQIEILLVH